MLENRYRLVCRCDISHLRCQGLSSFRLLGRVRKKIDPVYNWVSYNFLYQKIVVSSLQASTTEKEEKKYALSKQ